MRLIPFGTSSGRPTPSRNVSGLGVDLGSEWILVDCGEGTQQQVMRSPLKLSRLSAILITHLHGDHVLGLPGLLGTMGMEGRTAPLQLVGVDGIGRWLDVMCELPILGIDFPITITELVDDALAGAAGEPLHVADVGGFAVSALALRHRVPAFGYRIVEPTRRGHLDVEAARALGVTDGPDLGRLQRGETVPGRTGPVHPDQVVGPDRAGRTPADAAWVATTAGARRLLINHFSSRYDDPNELITEARSDFESTIAANELEPVDIPRC